MQFALCALLVLALRPFAASAGEFHPGEIWPDAAGAHVQAHGGGILVRGQTYYWYGEDRTPGGDGVVSCYSSTNLYDWKREGAALLRRDLPKPDGKRTFVERPKVLFNAHTGKYVMWMHQEQGGYHFARAGIAISDKPEGPFQFLTSIRPVTNDVDFKDNDANRQKEFGGTVRDMNLFQDDDGQAYAFYSSEDNWTMYVVRLNDEFTGPQLPAVENKTWARILRRQMREGPAPFKYNGRYYLITSACTGWKPNAADYAVADNILGPYEQKGNPCQGTNAATTFGAQSTFVLPAPGQPGHFIFMADQWKPRELSDSRYIWLPILFSQDGALSIPWRDHWDLSAGWSTN